ncbi:MULTISPECIES: hypothetical protein [Microbulbifer]|uniref:Uncharacterized protein n=1 Tax=Microbulbifer celer TaxID=435905 RepID=A0ABW3U4X8_9GAMM|nr:MULTISPECIES: hypothetical protein [Microbulbifer]UFN57841.1 hypothetical protein LPW13_02000 [Microbulbifer celer]
MLWSLVLSGFRVMLFRNAKVTAPTPQPSGQLAGKKWAFLSFVIAPTVDNQLKLTTAINAG